MQHIIRTYPVRNPRLKNYIKFFWEMNTDYMELNHKVIPLRNIDLKFNLTETPHYLCLNGEEHLLEDVYFSGLHDHFRNASMRLTGRVDMLGICFLPEGLYHFVGIPLSEFRNQWLGAAEIGFKPAKRIRERLMETSGITAKLDILETELSYMLDNYIYNPENFQLLFNALHQNNKSQHISEFCKKNDIGTRRLERLYDKYVGLSAKTYSTLNRFQNSLNQLLKNDYSRLSDIAYSNEYFDQMHFIRDFKRFAGNTPKNFIDQKNTMLHVGKLVQSV